MSKKGIILSCVLFLAIMSINCFYFINVETPIGSDNQIDNDLIAPKLSGYTITEKWKFESSTMDDLVISANGEYIAVSNESRGKVMLFNNESNKTLWTFDFGIDDVRSLDISADGSYISVGVTNGKAYLFNNTEAGFTGYKPPVWIFNAHLGNDALAATSRDGKYTIVALADYLYLLNNSYQSGDKDFEWIYSLGGSIEIKALDIGYNSIENKYYIAVGDSAGNVTLFDERDPFIHGYLWRNETSNPISRLKISDDGKYILAEKIGGGIYLFDKTMQTPKRALWSYSTPDVVDSDISADGTYIIISKESSVQYLNYKVTDPKQPEWEASTPSYISDGDISGDGKYILIGISPVMGSGIVKLYNSKKTLPKVEDWQESKGSSIPDVAINNFGNYFAIVQDGNTLYFYYHDVPLSSAILSDGGNGDDDKDVVSDNTILIISILTIIIVGVAATIIILYKYKP
ncbi:MAG: WD40 repeat domain-containing protein, partial [Promethearchaeota archaeon]